MGKKFNAYVAVHKDPADTVWFAPGDDVPDWAEGLVGDHVIAGAHEADEEEVDVRLTDPENEPDDPETKWSTVNTIPPAKPEALEDVDEVDLDSLTKAELIEEAEARGLDTSGTKAELKQRILDSEDETDDEE